MTIHGCLANIHANERKQNEYQKILYLQKIYSHVIFDNRFTVLNLSILSQDDFSTLLGLLVKLSF